MTLDSIPTLRRTGALHRRFQNSGRKVPHRHKKDGKQEFVPPLQGIVGMIGIHDSGDCQQTRHGLQLVLAAFTAVLQWGDDGCDDRELTDNVDTRASGTLRQDSRSRGWVGSVYRRTAIQGLFARSGQSPAQRAMTGTMLWRTHSTADRSTQACISKQVASETYLDHPNAEGLARKQLHRQYSGPSTAPTTAGKRKRQTAIGSGTTIRKDRTSPYGATGEEEAAYRVTLRATAIVGNPHPFTGHCA